MIHPTKFDFLRSGSRYLSISVILSLCALAGCGKTMKTEGTEQLLASDAIDKSIAKVDFSPLRGQTVYFDAQYIKTVKGIGFVNADYVISALRQQILAHGCRIVEDQKEADYIVEARVGALGGNEHNVVYGVPANNALSTISSVMPNTPPIPTIPELSVARRSHLSARAKVAVFAYERETGESVWQSGTSVADSDARDTWLFGAGPFQRGSVYQGTELAGVKVRFPWQKPKKQEQAQNYAFHHQKTFRDPKFAIPQEPETAIAEQDPEVKPTEAEVTPASHEEPAKESEAAPPVKNNEQDAKTEKPGKASVDLTPTD